MKLPAALLLTVNVTKAPPGAEVALVSSRVRTTVEQLESPAVNVLPAADTLIWFSPPRSQTVEVALLFLSQLKPLVAEEERVNVNAVDELSVTSLTASSREARMDASAV